MFTKYHIRLIIEGCRDLGNNGLNNGTKGFIPELEIDVLSPPHDFLGVAGNPAIFVNEHTYKLLGAQHKEWVLNQTIVLKESFLKTTPIHIIGAIVHETGHAFNVAAQIENNEANAYIYEIEVLRKLLETQSPLLFGCTQKDLKSYFANRLPLYKHSTHHNEYLAQLVEETKQQFQLEQPSPKPLKRSADSMFFFREIKRIASITHLVDVMII